MVSLSTQLLLQPNGSLTWNKPKRAAATLVTTKEFLQQTVVPHDPNHSTLFSLSKQFNNYWVTSVVLKVIMCLTLGNLRFTQITTIIFVQNTSYLTAYTYPLHKAQPVSAVQGYNWYSPSEPNTTHTTCRKIQSVNAFRHDTYSTHCALSSQLT